MSDSSSSIVLASAPPLLEECPGVTYEVGKRTYNVETDVGFVVRYTLECVISRPAKNGMSSKPLKSSMIAELVDEWHYTVFWRKFEELNLAFRYVATPIEAFGWNPCLCQFADDGSKPTIVDEAAFSETLSELQPMVKDRRTVRFKSFGLHRPGSALADEALILENYDMIQVKGAQTPENEPVYRALEESIVASLWKRHLDLDKEIRVVQSRQEYRGAIMTIRLRTSLEVAEISWEFRQEGSNFLLRAFRGSGGGFEFNETRPEKNGICVLEARSRTGSSSQSLNPGEEYFFSFFLTREVPVYERMSWIEKLIMEPKLVRVDTVIVDSLRFTLRIPTPKEVARVESRFAKKAAPVDPGREKITQAFQTLSTFVEFEESLTEWERQFAAQLEAKDYSEEEKREKREKLKMVLESLRVGSMP